MLFAGSKQWEVQKCSSQELGEQGKDADVMGSVLWPLAGGADRASPRAYQRPEPSKVLNQNVCRVSVPQIQQAPAIVFYSRIDEPDVTTSFPPLFQL